MIVKTLWGVRKGFEADMPELMEAWDENSIDNWSEGWEEACETAIKSWGDDLVAWRIIELDLSSASLLAAFAPTQIEAVAMPSKESRDA